MVLTTASSQREIKLVLLFLIYGFHVLPESLWWNWEGVVGKCLFLYLISKNKICCKLKAESCHIICKQIVNIFLPNTKVLLYWQQRYRCHRYSKWNNVHIFSSKASYNRFFRFQSRNKMTESMAIEDESMIIFWVTVSERQRNGRLWPWKELSLKLEKKQRAYMPTRCKVSWVGRGVWLVFISVKCNCDESVLLFVNV